jgi:hypothetical protein
VKIDRHIEVVTTETMAMKETGFGSIETCQRVCDVLKSRYAQVHFNEVQSERDLERIVDREPDLVVLCVKYVVDEEQHAKIWLSDYFSQHGIAYTGSNRATLEFDSDKSKAKNAVLEKGVATAKFFLAHPGIFANESNLPFPLPLFVKPLDAANGNGVDENSLVHVRQLRGEGRGDFHYLRQTRPGRGRPAGTGVHRSGLRRCCTQFSLDLAGGDRCTEERQRQPCPGLSREIRQ